MRPSSGSLTALEAAMSHHGPTGVWSFQPATERRLMAEACQGYRVLIIFAVTGSQAVQGAALFTGQTMREGTRVGQKLEWVSCFLVTLTLRVQLKFSLHNVQICWQFKE